MCDEVCGHGLVRLGQRPLVCLARKCDPDGGAVRRLSLYSRLSERVSRMSDPTPPISCAPQPAALRRQMTRLAQLPESPWLHQEVARRLADKLDAIKLMPQSWVDWSAFLGAGTELVQARYPKAKRWAVEPLDALGARRGQQRSQEGFRVLRSLFKRDADLVVTEPVVQAPWLPSGVDLLWANMTLHGAADLPTMMGQWHRHLAVDGFLMCSGLGPDTAKELRAMYQSLGWSLPTIDFVDMHDLGDELVKAGFADPVMDMERLTLTWATPEAMLAELRTWGGNVAFGRFAGWRTPRWRAKLMAAMREHLTRPDGRLGLTLELVYGHAIKPVPRAKVSEETRVSLDDMRTMIKRDKPRT